MFPSKCGGLLLVLAFGVIAPACGACPPRIPAPLVIDHFVDRPVTKPCALRPQPSYVPTGAPVLCQPGFACLTLAQLADWVENTDNLREWADEMERLCPPPATQPTTQPGGTP